MKENAVRKVILFNMVSLDGFFEGPGHDIDWHNVDQEFNNFAIEQLDIAGTLIFGRVTYEMMASFWPSALAIETDPEVAERMNRLSKLVFSHTLAQADWQNTRLVKGDPVAEITRLKNEPGGNMFVFGSANLSATLIAHGLIDEFRVIINPLILGSGTPLFQGIAERIQLRLTHSRIFSNGNVMLFYQPLGLSEM
jgi:dihydrofolate reductase